VGERARAFKGISPGLLPPLGIIFGLLVAFVAAQVWGDVDRANTAVNREASALRAVVLLSGSFPEAAQDRLRSLISRHIQEAQTEEWPAMARRRVTLTMIPTSLAQALQTTLTLTASGDGQVVAQREIVVALENALDARRQRILVSRSEVNWVKWTGLMIQAICTLTAIAMVHSDNRVTAGLAMGLFATAVAVCIVLIVAHDRPFTGYVSVQPAALMQVQPESPGTEGERATMKSVPLVALLLLTSSAAAAQDTGAGGRQVPGEMGFFLPKEIQWKEGPASLRKGARMVVLEGDPTREGVFTMRLRLPDGFEVAPHWHSQVEHVTVISGLIHFGFGDHFDRAATRPMPVGSLGYWPIGMRHFAWAEGETVLQLHGWGPWTITYVNPADDPRNTHDPR
jgi:hypothetical protein